MIIALQTLIFYRDSLLAVLDRWLPPLLSQLFLKFSRSGLMIEDEGSEDQVFADFDDEQGVVFVPPVYAQRYAAVCDCLMDERWFGKLEKVVNLGKHLDMAFIKYLSEVPGISKILGIDIDCSLPCSSDLLNSTFENYRRKRDKSLLIMLLHGNAADPDYRLIGCDAVIAIEMIEYMLPHDLDRLVHNLFGFIKPWIAIFTTPNADFNVLFKGLEKNGLRRLDHYFNWTRAQLHDWCSNIVARYPNYTVSCRGVGPGPPGTSHYGCCSQLVLFVSKDYQKQMELNVNSLALVANLPQPSQISDFVCGWESPIMDQRASNIICAYNEDSCSELRFPNYCSCQSISSPSYVSAVQFEDKSAQCNLDTELGKSFIMFNVEEMYEVVSPRRIAYHRVYVIEDVASRLNNTMYEVKKFSKTTQNLLTNNKIDSLVHTREVIEEITHLIKLLNFNLLSQCKENYTWCNINWGENAPYWNQYYEVMAVYNYPYEERDEDSLILDLVTDEINKLLDTECDCTAVQVKLEIPVELLMNAVKHITDDVERVTSLLEYNGYELDGDMVVHSRNVHDLVASREDDSVDETYSDWDTVDVNSISVSDDSAAALDVNARYLRRAIDRKVRKLRTMFTHDEDITRELNRVVCRLLKMALSSRNRHVPVRSRWLQCKLLDLLTLTEKAIVRRKIKFIEDYPLKALGYESQDEATSEMTELCRIKEDDTALRIVERYRHLVQATDTQSDNDVTELEYDFSNTSFFRNDPLEVRNCSELVNNDVCILQETTLHEKEDSCAPEQDIVVRQYDEKISRTQNWVNEETVLPAPVYVESINCLVSSGDDHSYCKARSKHPKSRKKRQLKNKRSSKNKASYEISLGKVFHTKKPDRKSRDTNFKVKNSKTNTSMKAMSSYKNLFKKLKNKATALENRKLFEYNWKFNSLVKPNDDLSPFPIVHHTIARPIPGSITKLPEHIAQMHFQEQKHTLDEVSKIETPVAATQDGILIDIVTQDDQETIALQRSVGTDPDSCPEAFEQELELTNETSLLYDDMTPCDEKVPIATENVHSQTIFLYDINEPSTSKGVRHVSMDVQCGTDAIAPNFVMLSATTSLTTVPKMLSNGIKIGDSSPDVREDKASDFGTCTYNPIKYCMSPRIISAGIKIKDSETRLRKSLTNLPDEKFSSCTELPNVRRLEVSPAQSGQINIEEPKALALNCDLDCEGTPSKISIEKPLNGENLKVTETLKQVSSHLKVDSCSKFNSIGSGSLPKSPLTVRFAQDENNLRSFMPRFPTTKYVRPKLSCGGVQVHSVSGYTGRQASEDVMYLGEWQKYRPKPVIRKKPYSCMAKKSKESTVKKTASASKNNSQPRPKKEMVNRVPREAPKQVRYSKMTKAKEEIKSNKMNKPPAEVKVQKPLLRSLQNSTKVSPKLTAGNVPKKKKSNTTVIRRTKSVPPVVKKDSNRSLRKSEKCYIPLYLRRMRKKLEAQNALIDNLTAEGPNSKKNQEPLQLEIPPNDIKTDLLQVYEPRENLSYIVFRNEIENVKSGTVLAETAVSVRSTERNSSMQRSLSPGSQSSSCSSPNSVATVRAVPTWPKPLSSKRHSTPNAKTNASRNVSENVMPSRNRKFKKIAAPKRDSDKDLNNKENVPESSHDAVTNDMDHVLSAGIIGTKENIFKGNILSDNLQASNKSIVKMSCVKNVDSKNKPGVSDENNEVRSNDNSNTVILTEPSQPEIVTRVSSGSVSPQESFRIVENRVLSEWISSPNRKITESHTSNILAAMKQLVEESLDFVDNSDNYCNIDTETIVLSREGSNHESLIGISPSLSKCFKTVEINESETFHSIIEQGAIDTGVSRSSPSVDDSDLLSFKSAPSLSKYSECFADIESFDFNNAEPNQSSVRDIFERKETILTQNPGILAIQAFSGFSMNVEPVVGDQPDYVNLIDSETGSGAYDTARFATSEEVFVSGRSSGAFVSTFVDEDSVVPNWLFQIISQQHSGVLGVPVPEAHMVDQDLPLAFEPDLDENGNEAAFAAGAGAGDGRGIHSDQSQDSSGRGSSLSSSDDSSGAHSEAIIIDPSAFIAQFEMLREASAASAPPAVLGTSARTAPFDAQTTRTPIGDQHPRRSNPAASDVDADVSSMDTDVPSDN